MGPTEASLRGGWDSPPRVCYSSTTLDWASAQTARRKRRPRAVPVMLAPCRDGEPQQVGGQRSQTPGVFAGMPSLP